MDNITAAMAAAFDSDPVVRAWLEGYATGKRQAEPQREDFDNAQQ